MNTTNDSDSAHLPQKENGTQDGFHMKRTEAMYWMCRLRETLCVILDSNVKFVGLEGSSLWDSVHADEFHTSIPARQFTFGGGREFDLSKINRLRLYGYLPIRNHRMDRSPFIEGTTLDAGTLKFEICMRYIRRFLWDRFELKAATHDVVVSGLERWSIPVERR